MENEVREKLKKFTQDPDWQLMQSIMEEHLEPLRDIMSIRPEWSNDQIASEVRGRQLTIKGLSDFLRSAGIINARDSSTKTTFR